MVTGENKYEEMLQNENCCIFLSSHRTVVCVIVSLQAADHVSRLLYIRLRSGQAWQAAFEAHPLTAQLPPEVLAGWTAWAAEHAKTFQRASSAAGGRNGSLSQMHHHHRGLPKRGYNVWSALHHFDCRDSGGSRPASWFCRREFPDLYETVLSQIDELPRARKRQSAIALSD